jgi:hypothetical protein
MLRQVPIESIVQILSPCRKTFGVSKSLFNTNPHQFGTITDELSSKFDKAKRSFEAQVRSKRHIRPKTWEHIIRTLGELHDDDPTEIEARLTSLRDQFDNFAERKYPLGIFGYASQEILPKTPDLKWLKPTLDHEIQLTLDWQKALGNPIEEFDVLVRSDSARTRTGQKLLKLAAQHHEPEARNTYLAGLVDLTYFQLIAMFLLGDGLTDDQISRIGRLFGDEEVRGVERWFEQIKAVSGKANWRFIDQALAKVKNIQYDPIGEYGRNNLRDKRKGRSPLYFHEVAHFIFEFRTKLPLEVDDLVLLERAYRLCVVADNYQESWSTLRKQVSMLPVPNLGDVLCVTYNAAVRRTTSQTG